MGKDAVLKCETCKAKISTGTDWHLYPEVETINPKRRAEELATEPPDILRFAGAACVSGI